jgi:hypothetical protein
LPKRVRNPEKRPESKRDREREPAKERILPPLLRLRAPITPLCSKSFTGRKRRLLDSVIFSSRLNLFIQRNPDLVLAYGFFSLILYPDFPSYDTFGLVV